MVWYSSSSVLVIVTIIVVLVVVVVVVIVVVVVVVVVAKPVTPQMSISTPSGHLYTWTSQAEYAVPLGPIQLASPVS